MHFGRYLKYACKNTPTLTEATEFLILLICPWPLNLHCCGNTRKTQVKGYLNVQIRRCQWNTTWGKLEVVLHTLHAIWRLGQATKAKAGLSGFLNRRFVRNANCRPWWHMSTKLYFRKIWKPMVKNAVNVGYMYLCTCCNVHMEQPIILNKLIDRHILFSPEKGIIYRLSFKWSTQKHLLLLEIYVVLSHCSTPCGTGI